MYINEPPPKFKTFFLIRHGESKWNEAQAAMNLKGMANKDHALTDTGMSQAERLNRTWRKKKERRDKKAKGAANVNFSSSRNNSCCSSRSRGSATSAFNTTGNGNRPNSKSAVEAPPDLLDLDWGVDDTHAAVQAAAASPATSAEAVANDLVPSSSRLSSRKVAAMAALVDLTDEEVDEAASSYIQDQRIDREKTELHELLISFHDEKQFALDRPWLRLLEEHIDEQNEEHVRLARESLTSAHAASNSSSLPSSATAVGGSSHAYDRESIIRSNVAHSEETERGTIYSTAETSQDIRNSYIMDADFKLSDLSDASDLSDVSDADDVIVQQNTQRNNNTGSLKYTGSRRRASAASVVTIDGHKKLNVYAQRRKGFAELFYRADKVFCSPLTRAIQTALAAMETHPAMLQEDILKKMSLFRLVKKMPIFN